MNNEISEKLRLLMRKEKQSPTFIVNDNNKMKSKSIYNIRQILQHDKHLKGMFRLNEFTSEIDVVKDFKDWKIVKGELKDSYIGRLASYIEEQPDYQRVLFDLSTVRTALDVVSAQNSYNPIEDYFRRVGDEWDGKHRLVEIFVKYLGVAPTPEAELIAKLFFYGVVKKAFNPTAKFDFVLDLVGGQGAGKTTFLQKIAPLGYYTDQFTTFDNKDDFGVMRRSIIINDDELTATSNSSFEVLKKFVTMQVFEYRKPYGHTSERFAKNFVMTRTTNQEYYLKDKTGERRFLPLLVRKDHQQFHPVSDLSQDYIDQVWGEAYVMVTNDEFTGVLTKAEEEALEEHRAHFMYSDETEDLIDGLMENEFVNKTFLTSSQIAFHISPGADLTRDRKLSNKIANIMINKYGWKKGRGRVNGKRSRGYIKPGFESE